MANFGGEELRAHPRITAPMRAFVHPKDGRPYELPVRDISLGGVFLLTSSEICRVGEVIDLELAEPDAAGGFLVKAEAVRSVMAPGKDDQLGIGFQFVDLRPEQQEALRRFVGGLLAGGGGQRRAYPRVSHRVAVQCTAVREVRAVLRDISAGGARLFVEVPLAVGERVALSLDRDRGPPLRLIGQVVSTYWAQPDEPYDQAGVQFIDLTDQLRAELRAYLGQILGR
ncbi:MAG TPA: PilZ domain-containing protein [Myxococcaceae bacterium]